MPSEGACGKKRKTSQMENAGCAKGLGWEAERRVPKN